MFAAGQSKETEAWTREPWTLFRQKSPRFTLSSSGQFHSPPTATGFGNCAKLYPSSGHELGVFRRLAICIEFHRRGINSLLTGRDGIFNSTNGLASFSYFDCNGYARPPSLRIIGFEDDLAGDGFSGVASGGDGDVDGFRRPGRKLSGEPDAGGASAGVDPAEDQRSFAVISDRNVNVRPFAGAIGLFDFDRIRQI